MEVKIIIDSSQVGDTVIDLFRNLSPEKREELAAEVVKSYLDEKVHQKVGWNDSLLNKINERIDSYFLEHLKDNETFIESKEKCIELLLCQLPEITLKAMTIAIATQINNSAWQLTDIVMKNMNIEANLNEVRQRMGLYY